MPVFNQIGAFIGVVALQMPVGRINDMMQVATGLGETGEAYIVGEDFLMRSDSRFSETSTILNRLVYTATSQKALAGESGIEVLEDARGGAVVSAYAPIEFMGARWAILAEISQAELLAPIAETGTFMIVAVAGILLLVTAVGIALARGLSRPIVEMTGNMRRLAAGDLDVEIGSTDRTDEIGEMAAALDVFKENAVRRQKAEASLKESGALFEQAGRMASLGHWAYDEIEERVTHCSEETARIHGLTVDEYKNSFSHGDTELMLVHPDDRQELGDIVENAYGDGKGYDTEYRIVRPDGAVRHVREVGEPVLDDSGTLVRTIGMVQDITERKETEDALRESQSLYLQAGRMAQFGHWIYDSAADRLVFCSEEVARMHGVSVDEIKSIIDSTEGSIGRVHPDDQEDYARAMRESEDRIEPYDLEIKIVRPDGAVRYLREMGEPVVDDNGSVVRYYGTIQDITERKNSEEELARKEAQLRIALDNMPGGILMIDEDNKIVVFNDQIRELFDLPEGVLVVGGPVETSVRYQAERGDFGEGDVDDLVEQVRAGFSSGEPTKYERRLFTGRVVEISVAPTPDGGEVAVYTDITERKRAEEELARKEAQLRVTLDNMPGGMFMIDENLVIQVYNEQYKEMYDFPDATVREGVSLAEAVRARAERGDYGPGDPEELVEQRMQGYVERMTLRHEEVLPNGRVIELLRTPVEGGGIVGITTDITERKAAEQKLTQTLGEFSAVLETIDYGIAFVDADLKARLFNRAVREMWDFSEEVLATMPAMADLMYLHRYKGIYDVADDEFDDYVATRVEAVRSGSIAPTEMTRADGKVFQFQCTALPDGGRMLTYFDITDRKRAEETLRASERRYATITANIPGVVYERVQHPDGSLEFPYVSDGLYETHGVKPEDAMRDANAWLDRTHPDDRESLAESNAESLAKLENWDHEYRIISGDGGTLWMHGSSHVYREENGDIVWHGILLDVTDRKRAEEALAEKETQLRVAMDNMPGGMMLGDRDLNFVLFNAQYSELCNFPDGLIEVGGSIYDEVRYQADRGDFGSGDMDDQIEGVAAIYQGGEVVSFEREIAGSGRTLQINVAPMPEGGYVSILTDVTDRKRAEEALAEKETQLRVAMDNMPGGMLMVDKDKSVVVINEQYRELFDIPEDLMDVGGSVEAAVRYQAERGDFGEGDVDELFDRAMAISPSGEPIRYERRLFSGRVVEISLAPTPDGGEIAVYTDITERKRAEEALAEKEMQFRLAMDNMPGALVYTDEDLDIVVCSERFSEIMQAPRELLQPGQPYTEFLRYLAEHGYYGEGDIEALVAERVKSLRSPSGKTFEDLTPDGRVYHIRRQRVAAGGTVTVATDITERKRADEALAEKEAQLRVAMDNMPGGMRLVDRDLENVLFNARYGALCNYPNDLLEVGGSMSDELRYQAERGDFGPGDADARIEQVLDCYRLGEAASVERDIPGGPTLQIDIAPTPEGGFVSILTDITERKRAEEALREKSAIVELLHKTAADANQAQDIDEAMRGCLDAVCAYTGWPVGHAYVRSSETPDLLVPTDIWHLDEPKRFATFRKVTKKASFEAGVGLPGRVMESGRSAWIVDVTADPNFPRAKQAKNIGVKAGFAVPVMVGGRVEAVFEFFAAQAVEPDAALLDILDNIGGQVGRVIERKQAEAEVRRSEAILSSVLDQSPVAFTLKDTERKLLIVNEAHAEWFGENKEDLIGASSDATNPPDQVEMFAAADNEVLEHQQVIKPFEYRDEMPPRASLDLMVFKFPVQGAEGEVLGIGTIQMDITERKKAENELAEAHQLITSSIEYASRIQRSALPSDDMLSEALGEHCVIWQPRDVVGGDIYWMRRIEGGHIVAVADCTGHGVPGAFLTMIAIGALRQAIIEHPDGDPAKVIGRMNSFIKNSLRQDTAEGPSDDGLELGICRIDEAGEHLTFAGARFSLWQLNSQGAEEIKGDKSGIAYRHVPLDQAITNHEVPLTPGSAYYIFSDGLVDQVGGEKRRAFGKKRIIALLEEHLAGPLAEQRDAVMAAFTAYQGDEIRRDDVTFLGFRMHS